MRRNKRIKIFLARIRTRVATRRKDESIDFTTGANNLIRATFNNVTLSFYGTNRDIVIMTPLSSVDFSPCHGSDIILPRVKAM